MGKVILLILISSLGTSVNASLGQKDFERFYGIYDPLPAKAQDFQFQEDYQRSKYIESKINLTLFDMESFLEHELKKGVSCPDYIYKKNEDYLLYLNRMLVLSYLFEANLEFKKHTEILRINTCNTNWGHEVKKCRPKSEEMKLFIKNFATFLQRESEIFISPEESKKKRVSQWRLNLRSNKRGDILQERIKMTCRQGLCLESSDKFISKKIEKVCKQDLELFHKVCSENDSFYGLSEIPEAYQLLLNSNILRTIKDGEDNYAPGCLRRFITENKQKEINSHLLRVNFSNLFEKMYSSKEEQYPQGRIFPLGALKEFQAKGLKNIYTDKKVVSNKTVKVITTPMPTGQIVPKILPKKNPVVVATPKKKSKKKRR